MNPISLTAVAVILSACSRLPAIGAGPNPSDPDTHVSAKPYRSVTAGAVDYWPVDPKPWIERNERVAPKAGGE
ncbi:hypothetical protein GCM10011491_35030 [Brucella endophytica]|uniref:RND transporter n=1 Tax=Brucella endophytica TaxID=1963359 RepID=A0A916WIR2_9HYPH|nr:hypothetical protein GCM10011491_35030 [Brucella endophytica]